MGVLDDAIREHLELKRRRGADPGSLKRDEDEALGEVVREPTQRELEQQAHAVPAAEQAPPEVVDQPTAAFAPEEVAEALGHPEPAPAAEPAESPLAPPTEPEGVEAAPPVPEADPPAPEAAQADPDAAPADDELASTPEFMEDAPEHDKLWFEQKPPKDFDF